MSRLHGVGDYDEKLVVLRLEPRLGLFDDALVVELAALDIVAELPVSSLISKGRVAREVRWVSESVFII